MPCGTPAAAGGVGPKPASRPTSATTRRSRRFGRQRKWRLGQFAAPLRLRSPWSIQGNGSPITTQLSMPVPAA